MCIIGGPPWWGDNVPTGRGRARFLPCFSKVSSGRPFSRSKDGSEGDQTHLDHAVGEPDLARVLRAGEGQGQRAMEERALSSGAVLHEVRVKVLKEGKAFLKEGNVGRKRDGG